MKKLLLIASALSLFACGGGKNNPSTPDIAELNSSSSVIPAAISSSSKAATSNRSPIQLSLSSLAKVSANTASEASGFDITVGDIYNSQNFYFIIHNGGDSAIHGLKITSTNPHFTMTPDSIPTLDIPEKSVGITPILKLAVKHGTPLTTMALEEQIPAGDQYTELTFTGITADTVFSVTYVIHARAMLADVKGWGNQYINKTLADGVHIDSTYPTWGIQGFGVKNAVLYCEATDDISIVSGGCTMRYEITGNCPITNYTGITYNPGEMVDFIPGGAIYFQATSPCQFKRDNWGTFVDEGGRRMNYGLTAPNM